MDTTGDHTRKRTTIDEDEARGLLRQAIEKKVSPKAADEEKPGEERSHGGRNGWRSRHYL